MNDFAREYSSVLRIRDSRKRGRAFERFAERLFGSEGSSVHHNPKAARPRQTDFVAEMDGTTLLVEAKSQKRKTGVPDVENLRDRLRRVPADFVGVMLSTSGYTASAIREIEADTTREILLFSPGEISQVLCDRLDLHKLVQMKRKHLRIHKTVQFYERNTSMERHHKLRDSRDLLKIGRACVGTISCHSQGSEILFARSVPDTKWAGVGGSPVILTLDLMLSDYEDLEHLIRKVDRLFGLSNHGSYAIHQTSTSWFGFGAGRFLREVTDWRRRYARAKLKETHHTEEIAYFDRLREGWIVVTAGHHIQREPKSCFLSGECTIQLSGVPVDMTPYARLCRETNNAEARFVQATTPGFYSARLTQEHRLMVRGEIIGRDGTDNSMVTGLVVQNPFFNASKLPKELLSHDGECPLNYITEVEYLVCYLADWHDYGDEVDYYFLRNVEGCWAGSTIVLKPICTWHKILKHVVTEEQHRDRFEKAIAKAIGRNPVELTD